MLKYDYTKKRNPTYFDALKRMLRLTVQDLLQLNMTAYTRSIELKYPGYHSKYLLAEDILINNGLQAYINR